MKFVPELDKLVLILDYVRQCAVSLGFGSRQISRILLSVEEAAVNVIQYAYEKQGKKEFDLHCEGVYQKYIKIFLTDNGKPFNPCNYQKPILNESLEERKIGGLGIYIIKQTMNEVVYERTSDNKNQLTLIAWYVE